MLNLPADNEGKRGENEMAKNIFIYIFIIFIRIMQNSINMKEDEDEEVVLKMASVKFDSNIEEPPTFDNNVYLAINS